MPTDGNRITSYQFWDAMSKTKTANPVAREAIVDASDVVLVMREVRRLNVSTKIDTEDD